MGPRTRESRQRKFIYLLRSDQLLSNLRIANRPSMHLITWKRFATGIPHFGVPTSLSVRDWTELFLHVGYCGKWVPSNYILPPLGKKIPWSLKLIICINESSKTDHVLDRSRSQFYFKNEQETCKCLKYCWFVCLGLI